MRVVKIGGRAQSDARFATLMANACRTTGPFAAGAAAAARSGGADEHALCLVHGGGDEVSALQRTLGLEPRFVGGRRVTSEADLDVVRMVLSGTTNKRIVAQLLGAGVRAVGISGEDANLFSAVPLDAATMGRVGGATTVDPRIVHVLCDAGFVPVISPLAREAGGNGAGLNVNGDDAAAALAIALAASELLLVVDVGGVLAAGAVLPELDAERAHALIASGEAAGGMAAKLQAAERALRGGVSVVRIAPLDGITNSTVGTRFVSAVTSASAFAPAPASA